MPIGTTDIDFSEIQTEFGGSNPISLNEYYAPTTGDIVLFHGSEHFHWIEPLRKGERKSLLMNFWPKDIGEAA